MALFFPKSASAYQLMLADVRRRAEPFSVAWHAADQAGATEDSSAFIAGCGPIGKSISCAP